MALTTEIKLIIDAQNRASAELAKVSADVNKLQANQLKQQQSSDKLRNTLVGLAGAYFAVKGVVIDSVKAYMESEKVMQQTNAVIKSTGGSAGMTADAVANLAKEMQYLTGFTDEEVQSAENLLLTFTNIKNDIFPQATETVLDMSIALGQDAKSSAIQLGKALQDPILGINALRRVGVNFNESSKETIKTMIDQGKIMDAQKYILKELQTEFGNSARMFGETFAGRLKIAQGAIDDLRESLGKSLLNSLSVAVGGADMNLSKLQKRVENASKFIEKWVSAFIISLKWVGKMVGNAGALVVQGLIGELNVFIGFGKDFWNNLKSIGTNIERFIGAVKKALTGDFDGALEEFKSMASDAMANTTRAVSDNASVMKEIVGQFSSDTTGSLDELNKAWDLNAQGTKDAANGIAGAYGDMGDSASGMAKKVAEARDKISDMKKEMKAAIKSAKEDIKEFKKEYQKQELAKEQELGTSIAHAIVDKQTELQKITQEYREQDDKNEKKKLQSEIEAINQFLEKHKSDQATYSSQIQKIKEFQAMDEIEQLRYTFAEEKKAREEDYKDQLKQLKKHLKDVEHEYKDKLKDLKKALQKELGGISISVDVNKSSSKKKKAFGGAVNAGEAYLVGEDRPEVFVPSQSGNIRQVGGSEVVVNFNNVNVRNDNDLETIIREVKKTLGRDSLLNRYGIRAS